MPFQTRRRVPFTARQMFDLVADVEKYPQFLPLCEALTVKTWREGDGAAIFQTCGDDGRVVIDSGRVTFTS